MATPNVMSKKESTQSALDRYFAKAAKEAEPKIPRKNEKPEITLTVRPVMDWLDESGFSCDVIESKAVYNVQAGRYLEGQTVMGMPDIIGCDMEGLGVFIECKAPGKRSSLRPAQREFLNDKIKHGAFAVVVDSVKDLERQYQGFRATEPQFQKEYLSAQMPKEPKRRTKAGISELDFL